MLSTIDNSKTSGLAALAAGLEVVGSVGPGENGSGEHKLGVTTDIQSNFVAANGFAVRTEGADKSLSKILFSLERTTKTNPEERDLIFNLSCRLLAHTRDCRAEGMGRGDRKPSWQLFCWLWDIFSDKREQLAYSLRVLYSKYGSIGDLNKLFDASDEYLSLSTGLVELRELIVTEWEKLLGPIFSNVKIINKDEKRIVTVINKADLPSNIGLIAKWAPREGKKVGFLAKKLARRLFTANTPFPVACGKYRRIVAHFTRESNVVETHMCHDASNEDCPKEGDWNIDYRKVPGVALRKHKGAFERRTPEEWAKYLDSLKNPDSNGAKGTSVFITDLVRDLLRKKDELAEAQWQDQVKNLKETAEKNGIDLEEFLGNFVCLLDFSGSMMGAPMDLAMAIGAFLTPLQGGPFKGRSLSFETKPHWNDINCVDTIREALQIFANSPWGGSTNFIAVHEMILNVLEDELNNGATPDEIKSMLPKFFLVVSDMQFDVANGYQQTNSWDTTHDILVKYYHSRGMELIGESLKLPTMIYWNARSDTEGFPVCSSTKNALFVSGTSTSVVKTFLTQGVESLANMTPWNYLEETLYNSWYNDIVNYPKAKEASVVENL